MMNEDTLDELRILAKDGGRIDAPERAILARAADELESALKMLIATQSLLIESQQKRLALGERLLDALKQLEHARDGRHLVLVPDLKYQLQPHRITA